MLIATLLVAACGSSSGNAGSSSGGSAGASNGTGSIACGPSLACSGNEVCCLPLDGSTQPTCATSCPSGTSTIECDGPEDCGGAPCCGSTTSGYQCGVGDACSPGVSQRCHNQNDCAGGTCAPATFGTTPLDSCQ